MIDIEVYPTDAYNSWIRTKPNIAFLMKIIYDLQHQPDYAWFSCIKPASIKHFDLDIADIPF